MTDCMRVGLVFKNQKEKAWPVARLLVCEGPWATASRFFWRPEVWRRFPGIQRRMVGDLLGSEVL